MVFISPTNTLFSKTLILDSVFAHKCESKKIIEKHFEKLIDMATNKDNPFEKNLHEIYEKELCFSPIPSLSIHCTNINSVFGVSPNTNFKKIWDENES